MDAASAIFGKILAGGSGGGGADNYSTTETVIGEWIDGRPIYRVVIPNLNASSGTIALSDYGVNDVEMLIRCDGYILNNSNNESYILTAVSGVANRYIINSSTANTVTYNSNSGVIYSWIVIEYVKSSD